MQTIRKMTQQDKKEVLEMMKVFYSSDAVSTSGSCEIFEKDIQNCINNSPYLEGYIFSENNITSGYAMLAKSFSTEFGKICIWIEDLYIKPQYRGMGIGTNFFKYIEEIYPECIFKLEVHADNQKAIQVYKKCGFEILSYLEMKKII